LLLLPASYTPTSFDYALTHNVYTILNLHISLCCTVRKPVHYHTIQTNQPKRCNSFTSLLLDVYVWLNMFRAPLRPLSGAYNCTRCLWFYRWSVAVGALLVVETTTNNAFFEISQFLTPFSAGRKLR
jgi:hypothetical protein